MSAYDIDLSPGALKDLRRVTDLRLHTRLTDAIARLASEPRPVGCLKLVGEVDQWRIRVGDWRILYSIDDGVLVVRDLGSKYGTFVNGRQIAEALLLPGDMLSVGLSNFVAVYAPPAAESGIFPRSETTAAEVDAPYQLAGQA